MRRFLSVALALVMSLCVSVPAFAVDSSFAAVPAEGTVMPPTRLITKVLNQTNTADTVRVTAQPENGNYLRFYYRNDTEYKCTVYLLKVDGSSQTIVGAMSVAGNSQGQGIFFSVNAGSGTYKIRVENTENGGLVSGLTSLAQYHTLSDMEASSAGAVSPALSGMPDSQLAYMDVYTASPEAQQAILNARAKIIYGNQAWTADGNASVVNLETGEVMRVPTFEELFPGWDLPKVETTNQIDASYPPCSSGSASDIFNCNVKTQLFHNTESWGKVVTFNGTGGKVGAFANSGPVDARYNLSVTKNGEGIGWYPQMAVREGVQFDTSTYFAYTVHASASDENSAGEWYRMIVTEDFQKYGF